MSEPEFRLEEKYLVPRALKANVLYLLSQHLKPSYIHQGTRFNGIDSIYFDSESLDLYKEHFVSPDRRFKLRARRYGPNGIWDRRNVILEMKAKEGRLTRKSRQQLTHSEYLDLRRSGLSFFRGYQLMPVCRVLYERHAFQERDVRVTLDEKIRYSWIRPISENVRSKILGSPYFDVAKSMTTRFAAADCLLLEVKHRGALPFWLMGVLRRLTEGEVKFSKYCFAVTQELR